LAPRTICSWSAKRAAYSTIFTAQLADPSSTYQAIRRSLKGDKDQSKPPHFSLTAKTATSIVPPKKVIKALYDYEPQNKNGQELAFHKGDFFHVLRYVAL
jgi:hypothetical protein